MGTSCPECGRKLERRAPNFVENVRRRDVDDVYDRFVCRNCEATFAEDDVVQQAEQSVQMKKWMNEDT